MSLVHTFTMDKCAPHTHLIYDQVTHLLCLPGNDKDSTVRVLRLEHLHDLSIYENSKPRIQRYRPILKYDQAQQYDRGIQYDDHIADLQVGVISNHTCQYIRTGTCTLRPENTSHTQS